MNWIVIAMVAALLMPIYAAWKDHHLKERDIWQKLLAFASIETKTSILILVVSVLRDDWMIG
ncbi:MAG: hypothetical protein F6K16_41340, partial [Symploca sp. SIO2B6]|nr:hypothetical protein [Symploca sp. SIO2B6]